MSASVVRDVGVIMSVSGLSTSSLKLSLLPAAKYRNLTSETNNIKIIKAFTMINGSISDFLYFLKETQHSTY
jgi:hypothetical protein